VVGGSTWIRVGWVGEWAFGEWRGIWLGVGTSGLSPGAISPVIVFVKIVIYRFSPYSEGGG